MKVSKIEISLIIRSFKKELNDDEQKIFSEWLNTNSENKEHYYHIKDVWDTMHFEKIRKSINTEQDWERLLLKAANEKKQVYLPGRSPHNLIRKILQIAAIVVITFGIGFFVNYLLPEQQEYATLNVPYGAKTELDLPDGSKVWVNSGSSLTYPVDINQKEATLSLDGEAYFDIAKKEGRQLNVKTSTITIQVHGTAFNVRSYEDDDLVETTLVRGSISLTGSVGGKSIVTPIVLKPNQQATLKKGYQTVLVEDITKDSVLTQKEDKIEKVTDYEKPSLTIREIAEVDDYTSWKNNKLVFKSQRFDELLVRMERWYNVDIVLEDKELSSSLYSGTFDKETIEQAMKALSMSLPFKYEIDKNRITIQKKL